MKQVLFVIITLPFLFAGCGKGDDKPSGTHVVSGSALAHTTAMYPNAEFQPITSEYGVFRVSYEFWENGCYTGRHYFRGHSHEYVRQRLCRRLQNDWRNNTCASGMRQAYFASICSGITWNPR